MEPNYEQLAEHVLDYYVEHRITGERGWVKSAIAGSGTDVRIKWDSGQSGVGHARDLLLLRHVLDPPIPDEIADGQVSVEDGEQDPDWPAGGWVDG